MPGTQWGIGAHSVGGVRVGYTVGRGAVHSRAVVLRGISQALGDHPCTHSRLFYFISLSRPTSFHLPEYHIELSFFAWSMHHSLPPPPCPPPPPLSRSQCLAWAQDPAGPLGTSPLSGSSQGLPEVALAPERDDDGGTAGPTDIVKDCHGNRARPGQLAGMSLAEPQAWPPTRAGLTWGAKAMWGGVATPQAPTRWGCVLSEESMVAFHR